MCLYFRLGNAVPLMEKQQREEGYLSLELSSVEWGVSGVYIYPWTLGASSTVFQGHVSTDIIVTVAACP